MRSSVPPLILLPGTLCDERVFAPLLLALRDRFSNLEAQVMLTADATSVREAAELVLLASPRRFALLGFSLGGIVGLEIALLAPQRVQGLALLSVNAAPAPGLTHASRREAVFQAQATGQAVYLREQLWPRYVADTAREDAEMREMLATMAEELGHEMFRRQTEVALSRRDVRPLLGTLTMPTLVQAGEHDVVCPPAAQREMAETFPQAQFALVANAGHFALLEQQDATAASVAAWFHTVVQQQELPIEETQ